MVKIKVTKEEVAALRFQLIANLIRPEIRDDPAAAAAERDRICAQTGLSTKTICRYVNAYLSSDDSGFNALIPKQTGRPGNRSIPPEILEHAIQLRRENPKRSVASIIWVMEEEGLIEKGDVKRSTLQDQLTSSGFSSTQMKIYSGHGLGARRFQHLHRNDLWQADIKNGHFINGKKTYMVAFIDDCTRFPIHAAFYHEQNAETVEGAFRKSILTYGVPKMVYFDNGGQFRNSVMHQSCSKLDVKLLFTKTYHPESKGKVERFNGTIEHFLSEVELDSLNITDLESLNKRFQAWVDIRYSNKEHSGIKKTPQEAYNDPSQPPQRFISEDEVYKAFLRTDSRKVDKSGCFSFDNRLFEMENGMTMVGRRVHFFFDPSDREKLWVDIPGHDITLAKPLNIKERAAPRPKLPPNIGKVDTTTSRVLEAAQKLHDAKNDSLKQAINFRELENKTND